MPRITVAVVTEAMEITLVVFVPPPPPAPPTWLIAELGDPPPPPPPPAPTSVACNLVALGNMVEIGKTTDNGITSVPMAKFMLGVNEFTESVVSPVAAAEESVTV